MIAAVDIDFAGNETVPAETRSPLLQVKLPLSIVLGRVTVPRKVGFDVFAKLFKEVCKSVPLRLIAGVLIPVVNVGLLMFAFNDIWFPMVVAKLGSLLMAASILCNVCKRLGVVPIKELIAESTYCVFAICVLFVCGAGVGA